MHRRTAEDRQMLQDFELVNFGTTSTLSPRSARLTQRSTGGSSSTSEGSRGKSRTKAVPGVYTIPSVGTIRPNGRRKKATNTNSEVSLPQPIPQILPGYECLNVDTTYEMSGSSRVTRLEEGRDVPIPKRVRLTNTAGGSNWVGEGDVAVDGEDSESDVDVASEESDGEHNWQDLEEGSNPAAVIDETGEIRENKRKTYASSDDPMALFLPMVDAILEETFVRESLPMNPSCQTCQTPLTATHPQNVSSPLSQTEGEPAATQPASVPELFKCVTCGEFLECRGCCLRRHQYTPLHMLKVWKAEGHFTRTSLQELGLCLQLGHNGGGCPVPGALRSVTVMHVNGVHAVSTSICGCDLSDESNEWRQYIRMGWYPASTAQPRTFATFECLRHFRRLNVVANVNVRDYVTTLERLSDPMGLEFVPDRYKSFGLMSQQVSYMDRMRRSGVAFLKGGVKTAPWGSTAVRCWACPRAKVNLPDNWKEVDESLQFKYALILGMDACFRMENRLRQKSKNKAYTVLADGLGCFAPRESYFTHLRNYVKEADISSCIAFAALMQKDTHLSKGLRATGVGGCICTRHEIIRPLGLGDLLKGERYANMDYIFWASILGEELAQYIVSYDVGCQWKINLLERRKALPAILRDESEPRSICVGLPVWHGGVHEEACGSLESLRFKEGAAMTDGEGVERVWSRLGPKAWATKEMHENTRHESLEDTMDEMNWTKNLGLGLILRRRYEVAKIEQREQRESFQSTSATLSIKQREEWMKWIKDWHSQEHILRKDKTVENPYESSWKGDIITVDKVHMELDREELEELRRENDDTTAGQLPQEGKAPYSIDITS